MRIKMNLRQRMKIDRDQRHKARRKLRAKAKNSSADRTILVHENYNKKRTLVQTIIEKFRKQNLNKISK